MDSACHLTSTACRLSNPAQPCLSAHFLNRGMRIPIVRERLVGACAPAAHRPAGAHLLRSTAATRYGRRRSVPATSLRKTQIAISSPVVTSLGQLKTASCGFPEKIRVVPSWAFIGGGVPCQHPVSNSVQTAR